MLLVAERSGEWLLFTVCDLLGYYLLGVNDLNEFNRNGSFFVCRNKKGIIAA